MHYMINCSELLTNSVDNLLESYWMIYPPHGICCYNILTHTKQS